jgi:tetratricopeptide (TPR) repeat protein
MKRIALLSALLVLPLLPAFSQTTPEKKSIDILLINGDFKKVIDTCTQIITEDSLNSEIYYKLGLAYQNLLSDEKALTCFNTAYSLSPENNNYKFTVAKSYFNRGRYSIAKPILQNLLASDTLNWPYASYLSGIYMQESKYEEAIRIYTPFYNQDTTNYVLADKIGFASLRNGEYEKAIGMFNRSLLLNKNNLNAIKNLAFLYAGTIGADTAIQLLTGGVEIDSNDIDLYVRRAAINYTITNYTDALPDYLKILNSGDSSFFNLKRAGICWAQTLKPEKAIQYLLIAYKKDSTDVDVQSNLALNYRILGDHTKSIYFYRAFLKTLAPVEAQLGLGNLLLAEELKAEGQYSKAIAAYNKSQEFRSDDNVIMIIANLYDEKLNDSPRALRYYETYLGRIKNSKDYDKKYIESIRARIDALKNPKK